MSTLRFRFGIIVFLCTFTALTLIALEILVRVLTSIAPIYAVEMAHYARVLKMRDPSQRISHVHRPNQSARLMGVDVTLNSLGHRGREFNFELLDPSVRRVLALGSSVTLGWGVPQERIWTTTLESRLNANAPFGEQATFHVENAGVGNYGTADCIELYHREQASLKPDVVILQYFLNDVNPRGIRETGWIYQYSDLAVFLQSFVHSLGYLSHHEQRLYSDFTQQYAPSAPNWRETQTALAELNDEIRRRNGQLLVMIVPDLRFLKNDTLFAKLYEIIEDRFRLAGIEVFNSFPDFRAKFGRLEPSRFWVQADDPHPNSAGHDLMADVAYRVMVERRIGIKKEIRR